MHDHELGCAFSPGMTLGGAHAGSNGLLLLLQGRPAAWRKCCTSLVVCYAALLGFGLDG